MSHGKPGSAHPERKEIARYLLSRGLDAIDQAPDPVRMAEYGTTTNHLDVEGAAVEMGDAALGLAVSELADPPNWAVVRNMSDPVINGDLRAKQFHLNEQTTWAVGSYTAYGLWTSTIGALATWGIIAGLT